MKPAEFAREALEELNSQFTDRAEYEAALEEVISTFQSALNAATEQDVAGSEEEEEEEEEELEAEEEEEEEKDEEELI